MEMSEIRAEIQSKRDRLLDDLYETNAEDHKGFDRYEEIQAYSIAVLLSQKCFKAEALIDELAEMSRRGPKSVTERHLMELSQMIQDWILIHDNLGGHT